MKKSIFLGLVLIALVLSGCNRVGDLTGDKPPKLILEIDGETYEAILGTYCWTRGCADTVGPNELLKDKEPIKVKPGEQVMLKMDYTPKPNVINFSQIENDQVEKDIEIIDNKFIAPDEAGIYHYVYSAWWKDEKDKDLSHGDAFYAFSLEVQQ
jgi:hypothetical protein